MPGQLLLHSHNPVVERLSDVLLEVLGQFEVIDTHLLTYALLVEVEGSFKTLQGNGRIYIDWEILDSRNLDKIFR